LSKVRPKKHLGQHFLRDEAIAKRIVDSLTFHGRYNHIVEVGPGTGVLSKYLMQQKRLNWLGLDVDTESIDYLREQFPKHADKIIEKDFLKVNLDDMFDGEKVAVIGNFPYNISTQILFKILEYRNVVTEMVGMFQKEVAMRVISGPGGKVNGILSILCQAYFDVEYLFQVDEHVFEPPPKVKSSVIRFKRNAVDKLACDERRFFVVVKTAFNQRRKTLRNSLKSMQVPWDEADLGYLSGKRAEELRVEDFVQITLSLQK
jgi:16S rRNA (adenine1518-N6/adenine1519-N6)-dimethyltransferase